MDKQEMTATLELISERCARIPEMLRERVAVEAPDGVVFDDDDEDASMCCDLLRNVSGALELIMNSV